MLVAIKAAVVGLGTPERATIHTVIEAVADSNQGGSRELCKP